MRLCAGLRVGNLPPLVHQKFFCQEQRYPLDIFALPRAAESGFVVPRLRGPGHLAALAFTLA